MKFNMLMCYCIGKTVSSMEEFYLLPVGDRLMQYDALAVNTIVKNKKGEVSSCDIKFCENLRKFNESYLHFTEQARSTCENYDVTDAKTHK